MTGWGKGGLTCAPFSGNPDRPCLSQCCLVRPPRAYCNVRHSHPLGGKTSDHCSLANLFVFLLATEISEELALFLAVGKGTGLLCEAADESAGDMGPSQQGPCLGEGPGGRGAKQKMLFSRGGCRLGTAGLGLLRQVGPGPR